MAETKKHKPTIKKFTHVKRHPEGIEKQCMHCHRTATVTAVRSNGKFKIDVHYCADHAKQRGVPERKPKKQ